MTKGGEIKPKPPTRQFAHQFQRSQLLSLLKTISYHSPRLPNKLLNNPHLCAGEQACGGCVSRLFEGTEEAFGDFQFTAEEARGGAVCLVGIVTLGEGAEVLERHGEG